MPDLGPFLDIVKEQVLRTGWVNVSQLLLDDYLRNPAYDHPLGSAIFAFAGLPSPQEVWERALRVRGLKAEKHAWLLDHGHA